MVIFQLVMIKRSKRGFENMSYSTSEESGGRMNVEHNMLSGFRLGEIRTDGDKTCARQRLT